MEGEEAAEALRLGQFGEVLIFLAGKSVHFGAAKLGVYPASNDTLRFVSTTWNLSLVHRPQRTHCRTYSSV